MTASITSGPTSNHIARYSREQGTIHTLGTQSNLLQVKQNTESGLGWLRLDNEAGLITYGYKGRFICPQSIWT